MKRQRTRFDGDATTPTRTQAIHRSNRKNQLQEEHIELCERIALRTGADAVTLAEIIGVKEKTLKSWISYGRAVERRLNTDPTIMLSETESRQLRFYVAITEARHQHDSTRVVSSLLRRALGYEYVETSMEELKIKRGRGKNAISMPAVRTRSTTKQVVPDVGAIVFWLCNRMPDQWQHVQKYLTETKGVVAHLHQHKHEGEVGLNLDKLGKQKLEQLRTIIAEAEEVPEREDSDASGSGQRAGKMLAPSFR